MRAVDAWAIDERGVPSLDLMERAGAGLARVDGRGCARRGPDSHRGAARATTAATGWWRRGCCARTATRSTSWRRADPASCAATRPRTWSACPAIRRSRSRRALEGAGVVVDALLGTGFEGEPREPVAGAIAAINAPAGAGGCLRRPLRCGRLHRRGGRRGRAAPRPRPSTARRWGCASSRASTHAGRSRWSRSGSRAARPRRRARRADLGARARPRPRRARSGSKFESGVVVVAGGSLGLTGAPRWRALGRSAPAPATCRWPFRRSASRCWSSACSRR